MEPLSEEITQPKRRTVHFLIQGQFGNNFFQYLAGEIIKKIYGYDEVKPTFFINLEFNTVIDDAAYKKIILAYMSGHTSEIDRLIAARHTVQMEHEMSFNFLLQF